MSSSPHYRVPVLPWDRQAEDERRFRKIIVMFLILFVLVTLVVSRIHVPEKQREDVETVPPRLAKLVMERQKPPPPPPPPPVVEEKPEPTPEPEKEAPKEEKPPEVAKEEKVEPPKPSARERARAAIAVFDDLADLRDQSQLQKLDARQEAMTGTGADERTDRALISRAGAGGSGGVAVARASSGGGGSGTLSGVTTTEVESSLGDATAEVARRAPASGIARRTTEEIQLVFDQHKGSIFSLYRRALRTNPTLEGTLVLRLVIQPDGSVSRCEVVSSQLRDADLERRIVLRIQQINFGARNVEVWNDTYPLNFIPS